METFMLKTPFSRPGPPECFNIGCWGVFEYKTKLHKFVQGSSSGCFSTKLQFQNTEFSLTLLLKLLSELGVFSRKRLNETALEVCTSSLTSSLARPPSDALWHGIIAIMWRPLIG
uniref:Uncharacterized protein n=1 Tax=Mucochytrium quahogii TaxID=96639 RepID=A0A7S2S5Y5_9STRA|mmetsp:Transcript_39350/g.63887  ORF Transcript_39350/g.63887 Transcript_39350/m.63887 type:complete len:115 (+) Transcript_39350:189-533(+)